MSLIREHAPKEEGEYEYAANHQRGEKSKEARLEPAVLYQPLGEAGGTETSEHQQPEHGGSTHNVSGDGCGDGGYCGGHWVRRSEKGHRHGERINNVGDPTPVSGCTLVAGGAAATGVGAGAGVVIGFGCGIAALAAYG